MVARPSLKRVVPGSVPPWRALCAESARALKAFFSVLCVSKSVLLLESKFGQILRALNLRAFWVRPSRPRAGRSFCGLAVARPRWSRARFLLRARVFRGPVVVSGCRNFHFRQSRTAAACLRLIRSPRHALGFAQRRTSKLAGVAAKRELEIIAKPLGLLHEALLSGRSFLRTETRSYFLPLQRIACRLPICLVRCSPIFAIVTYFVGRAARALRSFVELRWCGS